MEKTNTKEQILNVALDLFSVKGYEATSLSQIAEVVGIRKASLYSHFASKKELLNYLIDNLTKQYEAHSIFANADWDDPKFIEDKQKMSIEDLINMIKGQIHFIVNDPQISKVRRLLTIEQYQNPYLSKIHSKQSYEDVIKYNMGLIGFMIKQGILVDKGVEIMAAQFAFPISMWIGVCDREPERESEMMKLVERHIREFISMYQK